MEYVVAIDQGTTGTRCMLFDRQGHVRAAEYVEHEQPDIVPDKGFQMIDMAVNVAVREQSDQVKALPIAARIGNQVLPDRAVKQASIGNGLVDQGRTLFENPTATDGVVADLTVAHVLVRGHPHRLAVGLEAGGQAVGGHPVQDGGVGLAHHIAFGMFADTDAVHDEQDDGALGAGK